MSDADDSVTDADSPSGAQSVSPWRLIATLGGAGAVAGFLIVFVFAATQPRIQAYKARVLASAIQEVLASPERYDTLYVVGGRLVVDPPEGGDLGTTEQVYLGYRDERPIGYAVVAAKGGFQDVIRLIYGYDPRSRRVLGMLVLDSRETPGLGDKIIKDSTFVAEFTGVETPLTGLKSGRKEDPTAPGGIDMITGATISSRTVISAINLSLEQLAPLMEAYLTNALGRGGVR